MGSFIQRTTRRVLTTAHVCPVFSSSYPRDANEHVFQPGMGTKELRTMQQVGGCMSKPSR